MKVKILMILGLALLLGACSEESQQQAKDAMGKVAACKENCCFIVTERHDMVRKPWKPIFWIGKNKLKLHFNIQTEFE